MESRGSRLGSRANPLPPPRFPLPSGLARRLPGQAKSSVSVSTPVINFRDHARESKMEIPKEPFIFFKPTSSVAGPNDDVVIPKGGQKVDWEVELAAVIGKKGGYIEPGGALEYVAGYILHNDYRTGISVGAKRAIGQGKSADTCAPLS